MPITAIIETAEHHSLLLENTLILDLPRSPADIQEKLRSIGIVRSSSEIKLISGERDNIQVKLSAGDDVGKHLLLAVSQQDTLSGLNSLAYILSNARSDIRSELENSIIHDEYGSLRDALDGARRIIYDAGEYEEFFYCPLYGNVDVGAGDYYPASNRYLRSYQWAIEDALKQANEASMVDMTVLFGKDEGLKSKFVSAKWGVERYRGRLFGRIECQLKEPLTDSEMESVKEWISDQNYRGFGEQFEQYVIDTEDGDMTVSFWNGGNDYAILMRDELNDYIENHEISMGGM